ncbi:hypothetical protein EVAR_89829_1 [Eumeta japonica]|uniref:Uncharacterized protein n=1 Tax=Eumeta variegata TaxID=151549 RepID=A0A4C1YL20_EUMVA|nr:hypothetical protein EVAR_89829_1 [Eumeta japonica]
MTHCRVPLSRACERERGTSERGVLSVQIIDRPGDRAGHADPVWLESANERCHKWGDHFRSRRLNVCSDARSKLGLLTTKPPSFPSPALHIMIEW